MAFEVKLYIVTICIMLLVTLIGRYKKYEVINSNLTILWIGMLTVGWLLLYPILLVLGLYLIYAKFKKT